MRKARVLFGNHNPLNDKADRTQNNKPTKNKKTRRETKASGARKEKKISRKTKDEKEEQSKTVIRNMKLNNEKIKKY